METALVYNCNAPELCKLDCITAQDFPIFSNCFRNFPICDFISKQYATAFTIEMKPTQTTSTQKKQKYNFDGNNQKSYTNPPEGFEKTNA